MSQNPAIPSPKVFMKGVQIRLVPQIEIAAAFEPHGKAARHDERYAFPLEKDEFITDGKDELAVVLFVHRISSPADLAYALGEIKKVKLSGPGSGDHKLEEDSAYALEPANKGKRRFFIRSRTGRALLFTAARSRGGMKLEVEGQVALPHQGPGRPLRVPMVLTSEVAVRPCYLALKLWVVPGQQRGTSTAGVASFLRRGNGKLQYFPVLSDDLEVKATATGPTLTASKLSAFVRSGGSHSVITVDLPSWLSAWKLKYSGLTWSNLAGANIRVYCRFKNGDEAVDFKIDVRQNLGEMINDLDANSGALQLTNPEWQGYGPTSLLGMLLARRECRGPIYNLREDCRKAIYYVRGMDYPPDVDRYVCGEYSSRLRRHVVQRRNGAVDPQTALRMNGIEACQYIVPLVHDWFGFHLSGSQPGSDPIFIDPWWTQEWNVAELKDNYGFKKQAALMTAVGALLSAYFVPLAYFILRAILQRWPQFAKSVPTLIEVVKVLRERVTKLMVALASLAASIAFDFTAWCAQTPTHSDGTCFDDDFDYAFYVELPLFQKYCNALMKTPVIPISVVAWPI